MAEQGDEGRALPRAGSNDTLMADVEGILSRMDPPATVHDTEVDTCDLSQSPPSVMDHPVLEGKFSSVRTPENLLNLIFRISPVLKSATVPLTVLSSGGFPK